MHQMTTFKLEMAVERFLDNCINQKSDKEKKARLQETNISVEALELLLNLTKI